MVAKNIGNRLALAWSYFSRKDRIGAFPFEVAIGITNRCNLDCVTCPRRFSRLPEGNIALDLFEELIGQAAPYVDAVDLSFDGEPFLHPSWAECIKICHRHGVRAILQTNALLMNKSLAREVLAAGVDSITFSIDAATPETYRRLKSGGDFDLVVANTENFLRRTRSHRRRPHIVVQMVRSTANIHEVPAFIRRWRGKGADFIRIKPMLNFGGSVGSPPARPPRKHCILLWSSIAVHWNGVVPLCCMEIEGRTKMGDATAEVLTGIIDNQAFREVRRLHLSGRYREHPVCRNCDVPALAWPFVLGAAFVGDLTRRKLISLTGRFISLKR